MANVLAQLNVSFGPQLAASSGGRNGLHQYSSQPRLAIGTWSLQTWNEADGPKQSFLWRSKRSLGRTGSRFQCQISSPRQDVSSTPDSRAEDAVDETATASGIMEDGSSGTQLSIDLIELEKSIFANSALSSSPEATQMQQPMDMESRGAAEYQHPYHNLKVAPRWREIQGEKHWAGMLDPLDPVLRGEIIRYGEFAQASYDAFDYNRNSPYCGSCKYNKKRLLQKVGLENRGYQVTDYFYVTAGNGNAVANLLRKVDFDATDGIDPGEVWDPESNWMGFVAVCTDPKEIARLGRRDIIIVWRGTVTNLEWLQNVTDFLVPTGLDPRRKGPGLANLKVEAGFLDLYTARDEKSRFSNKSAREQVLEAVRRLVHQYRFEKLSITVTGHSLGSALAKLCAYDFAESSINVRLQPHDEMKVPDWEDPKGLAPRVKKLIDDKIQAELGPIPITVFSFGGPRVGNDAFRDRMEELGVRVLRVVNKHDVVPRVPGVIVNEKLGFLEEKLKPIWRWLDTLPWTYTHVGVQLEVDNLRSNFLKKSRSPSNAHDLEAYLHLVDGHHGLEREFKPRIGRDIALVNKAADILSPRYFIPPKWFQEENKGLMRTKEGKWVLRVRDPEDLPENQLEI